VAYFLGKNPIIELGTVVRRLSFSSFLLSGVAPSFVFFLALYRLLIGTVEWKLKDKS